MTLGRGNRLGIVSFPLSETSEEESRATPRAADALVQFYVSSFRVESSLFESLGTN